MCLCVQVQNDLDEFDRRLSTFQAPAQLEADRQRTIQFCPLPAPVGNATRHMARKAKPLDLAIATASESALPTVKAASDEHVMAKKIKNMEQGASPGDILIASRQDGKAPSTNSYSVWSADYDRSKASTQRKPFGMGQAL